MNESVVERRDIKGAKANWNRVASIEVYNGGVVRIQQDGHPVDVVLLTARQVRDIAAASERARTA